jgi:hypothetical protein
MRQILLKELAASPEPI